MTQHSARSMSIAITGGLAAAVFLRSGLYFWAGAVAWAICMEAGGNGDAIKRTIAGTAFGALLGWAALVVALLIPVPQSDWAWVTRGAILVAVTLSIAASASKTGLLSNFTAVLAGYGAVFGAYYMAVLQMAGLARLTTYQLENPLVAVVISMAVGALFGAVSSRLTASFAKG